MYVYVCVFVCMHTHDGKWTGAVNHYHAHLCVFEVFFLRQVHTHPTITLSNMRNTPVVTPPKYPPIAVALSPIALRSVKLLPLMKMQN